MRILGLTEITAAALMASTAIAFAQGGSPGGAGGGSGGVIQQQPGAPGGGMQQPGGGMGGSMQQQPGGMQQPGRQEGTGTFTGPRQGGGTQGVEKGTFGDTMKQQRGATQKGESVDRQPSGQAQEGADKGTGAAGTQKGAGGGVGARPQLSSEERTRIKTVLKDGPRASNVNVSLSVGTQLPRTVTLRPLPVSVIEIVPQYRGYHYVLVKDVIVIVDPATYAIVAVLDV